MKRALVAILAAALRGAAPARADVYDDNPAAASRGPGDVLALARGADGAIYERHLVGGAPTAWTSIRGQASSGPAAAAYGDAIHAFITGTDYAVYENVLRSGSWSGWMSLGGVASSAPAAIARRVTTQLDLAIRGKSNAIYHRVFQPGAGWSPRASIGGILTSALAIRSRHQDQLDLFVRGIDRSTFQRRVRRRAGPGSSTSTGSRWSRRRRRCRTARPPRGVRARYWRTSRHHGVACGTRLVVVDRLGSGRSRRRPPAPPPRTGTSSWSPACGVRRRGLRVSLKIRRREGRQAPRVRRVVFFVKRGPRRVDRRRPWLRRLPPNRAAGAKGRVFARAFFTRRARRSCAA